MKTAPACSTMADEKRLERTQNKENPFVFFRDVLDQTKENEQEEDDKIVAKYFDGKVAVQFFLG